jgi:cytochrome c2
MKNKLLLKNSLCCLLILLLTGFFLVINFNYERYQTFKNNFKENTKRQFNIMRYGEKGYIEKIITKQYDGYTEEKNSKHKKVIETASLPVNLNLIQLNKYHRFAGGGGSFTLFGANVLVVDRLGSFYKVNLSNSRKIDKLNFPSIPNNLDSFILRSSVGKNLSDIHMRVTSIAYDIKRAKLYVGYTQYISDACNKFTIASLKVNLDLNHEGTWRNVYESQCVTINHASHEGGGKILVVKNKLYFSIGYPDSIGFQDEEGQDHIYNTQNKNTSFGKIFEYDLESNFLKMLTLGHRNPQGLAFLNEVLYEVEHGPQGGDEINIIKEGFNYGWPIITNGTKYGMYDYKVDFKNEPNQKFQDPLYAFVPSIGISSIVGIKGFNDRWNHNLLIGSLKSQSLFRIKLNNQGFVEFVEPIWLGHRIRDISQFHKTIILLTDDSTLILITVNEDLLKKNIKNVTFKFQDHERKIEKCLKCHSFDQSNQSSIAPSLRNVINRKFASDNFYNHYSEAIKKSSGVWSKNNLIKFIQNPQEVIGGTTMPNLDISTEEAEELVDILFKYNQ